MAKLAESPVIGVAVKTNPNTAYEMMKQHGQGGRLVDDYEPISSPPGGPPPDVDEKYDIPSPPTSHQPLPAIPPPVAPPTASNVGVSEEEEGVYESIPGDK